MVVQFLGETDVSSYCRQRNSLSLLLVGSLASRSVSSKLASYRHLIGVTFLYRLDATQGQWDPQCFKPGEDPPQTADSRGECQNWYLNWIAKILGFGKWAKGTNVRDGVAHEVGDWIQKRLLRLPAGTNHRKTGNPFGSRLFRLLADTRQWPARNRPLIGILVHTTQRTIYENQNLRNLMRGTRDSLI